MSKRILMIADADGYWTKRYIEHLLLPEGYQVVLFPIWGSNGTYDAFYKARGVTVYRDSHTLPVIRHIPRLRMWARVALNAKALAALGPFDVVHNHYLSQRDLALGGRLHRKYPKARWVCSFWGSDLMRGDLHTHERMRHYLERADVITIHSALQHETMMNIYGPSIAEKTALVYFGQTIFADIDRVRQEMDKATCKASFGIPEGNRVVCVGYNASPAQHQPEVLRALQSMPRSGFEGFTLVLQLSYGGHDEAYLDTVRECAQALPCQTILLTEFLDETATARLRLCADVFILAIQTDSFSASLQEYLYAGCKALVAEWLQYPQLQELGIETTSFADYQEIPKLLKEELASSLGEEQRASRAQLKDHYSWDAVREGWLKLYQA